MSSLPTEFKLFHMLPPQKVEPQVFRINPTPKQDNFLTVPSYSPLTPQARTLQFPKSSEHRILHARRASNKTPVHNSKDEHSNIKAPNTVLYTSPDLPKMLSLKSPQGLMPPYLLHESISQEASSEMSEILKPRLQAPTEPKPQVQKFMRPVASNGTIKFVRLNPHNDMIETIKLSGLHERTLTEENHKSTLKNFSNLVANTDQDDPTKEPFLALNGLKSVEELDKTPKEAARKVNKYQHSKVSSLLDLKAMVKKNMTRLPDVKPDRLVIPSDLRGLEEDISRDLAKGSIIKDDGNVQGRVRVYRRNKDTMLHMDRSISSISPTSKNLGFKSFQSRTLKNSDLKKSRERPSMEPSSQKSLAYKSYNLEAKRHSDTSLLENMRSNGRKLKVPSKVVVDSSLLDKSHERHSSSITIHNSELIFGTEVNGTAMRASKGISTVDSRTMKGSSVSHVFTPQPPEEKLKFLGTISSFVDEDMKSEELNPKSFRKLEDYLKSGLHEDKVKKEEEKKHITDENKSQEIMQRSIFKGAGPITKPSAIIKSFPKEAEEIHGQINELLKKVAQQKIQNDMRPSNSKEISLKGQNLILDEIDIQKIKKEYEKAKVNPESFNHELIDSLVTKLDFFSRLYKAVRVNLLKSATYAHYPSGSTIYRKGEFGDQMYIILRGSVNVRGTKTTSTGQKENVITAVLYDGAHFGEYTLVGTAEENNKKGEPEYKVCTHMGTLDLETGEGNTGSQPSTRKTLKRKVHVGSLNHLTEEAALDDDSPIGIERPGLLEDKKSVTIEVAESCDLLCIPRDLFQTIFLNLSQKELDIKLKLFSSLSFFEKLDAFGLIPLANNVVTKTYKMGEIIIREGEQIDRVRIISQGRCNIALGTLRTADLAAAQKFLKKQSIEKAMTFGIPQYKSKTPKSTLNLKSSDLMANKRLSYHDNSGINKTFNQETVEIRDGKLHYLEHIVYGTLARGDVIGGRAFLIQDDFTNEDRKAGINKYLGPARLSVVADSPLVEVYELDYEHAAFVPEFLIKVMKRGFKRAKEFDDHDIEKEKNEYEGWAKYKEKEVRNVILTKTKTLDSEHSKLY